MRNRQKVIDALMRRAEKEVLEFQQAQKQAATWKKISVSGDTNWTTANDVIVSKRYGEAKKHDIKAPVFTFTITGSGESELFGVPSVSKTIEISPVTTHDNGETWKSAAYSLAPTDVLSYDGKALALPDSFEIVYSVATGRSSAGSAYLGGQPKTVTWSVVPSPGKDGIAVAITDQLEDTLKKIYTSLFGDRNSSDEKERSIATVLERLSLLGGFTEAKSMFRDILRAELAKEMLNITDEGITVQNDFRVPTFVGSTPSGAVDISDSTSRKDQSVKGAAKINSLMTAYANAVSNAIQNALTNWYAGLKDIQQQAINALKGQPGETVAPVVKESGGTKTVNTVDELYDLVQRSKLLTSGIMPSQQPGMLSGWRTPSEFTERSGIPTALGLLRSGPYLETLWARTRYMYDLLSEALKGTANVRTFLQKLTGKNIISPADPVLVGLFGHNPKDPADPVTAVLNKVALNKKLDEKDLAALTDAIKDASQSGYRLAQTDVPMVGLPPSAPSFWGTWTAIEQTLPMFRGEQATSAQKKAAKALEQEISQAKAIEMWAGLPPATRWYATKNAIAMALADPIINRFSQLKDLLKSIYNLMNSGYFAAEKLENPDADTTRRMNDIIQQAENALSMYQNVKAGGSTTPLPY